MPPQAQPSPPSFTRRQPHLTRQRDEGGDDEDDDEDDENNDDDDNDDGECSCDDVRRLTGRCRT